MLWLFSSVGCLWGKRQSVNTCFYLSFSATFGSKCDNYNGKRCESCDDDDDDYVGPKGELLNSKFEEGKRGKETTFSMLVDFLAQRVKYEKSFREIESEKKGKRAVSKPLNQVTTNVISMISPLLLPLALPLPLHLYL